MRTVTLSAYCAIMAAVAAKWGADEGAGNPKQPCWTCPLTGARFRIDLRGVPGDREAMVPRAGWGRSGSWADDLGVVLTQIRSQAAVGERCMSAFAEVADLRVVLGDDKDVTP